MERGEINNSSEANRKHFLYFLAIVALHSFLMRMIGYFLPLYFEELGYSGVQFGFYLMFASFSMIILSLPMGISTDKKPIAYILMFSFLLGAISRVGFIISKSLIVFCAFAFVGSFGMRFVNVAKESIFFKISKKESPIEAGQYQLASSVFMGIGMIIGSFIIAGFSFWHVFVISAVGNLMLAFFSYFVPRTETMVIKLEDYKIALFTPKVFFLIFIFFLSSFHWGAEMVSYSKFLKHNLLLSTQGIGLYTGLGFFFVGLGAYLGVVLVQKKIIKDLQILLIIGFFMSGIFHILMCVNNVYLSFFFRIWHEIGDGLVFLAFYHGIPRIFHVRTIGGCAAFISLWMGIGSFSSAILFGYIGDKLGNQWPLIISGIILAIIPFLIYWRKKVVADII
jgi:MFS family permease